MTKKFFRAYFAALVIVFSLAVIASAQADPQENIENIDIKNFGKMDERFYRGGQPKKDEFKQLAELGVTTVIDLRDDPKDYEKPIVESLGMKYVNIKMNDKTYPKQESVDEFLKLMNDPATGVVYVHCKGGRHRTGALGAVYRYTKYEWDYDQIFKEMKDFKFYTLLWYYTPIKKFVKDYGEKIEADRAALNSPTKTETETIAEAN
ncbi:MAG: tyrosine-protein phosphatase [Pyrinomonadaceae bacterium]